METYFSKYSQTIIIIWILYLFILMNDILKFIEVSDNNQLLNIAIAINKYIENKENKDILISYKFIRKYLINILIYSLVFMCIYGWWSAIDGVSKNELKSWPIVLILCNNIIIGVTTLELLHLQDIENNKYNIFIINNKQKKVMIIIINIIFLLFLLYYYI